MNWYEEFIDIVIWLVALTFLYHLWFRVFFHFVDDGQDIQKVEVVNSEWKRT